MHKIAQLNDNHAFLSSLVSNFDEICVERGLDLERKRWGWPSGVGRGEIHLSEQALNASPQLEIINACELTIVFETGKFMLQIIIC